jgi:8-oxo-(d)GTP phosphatase
VWRETVGGAEVALVHRPKYDDWSFAKGKLMPGEHVLQAAVREVAEETGIDVDLGRRLPSVSYLARGAPKHVDYWAATADAEVPEFTANSEVDELAWLPPAEAERRLSYQHDQAVLAAFRDGPLRTVPLILLRHVSAGKKSEWPGEDLARPLDAAGKQDAGLLASLLRCFGASRVVSSPAERCVATLRPYAATTGAEVEIEPAFGVAGDESGADAVGPGRAGDGVAAAAIALATTRLASSGQPAVICAHRENLPVMLEAACAELGAEVPAVRPLRKGEFMVLHRADGKLAAVECHQPAEPRLPAVFMIAPGCGCCDTTANFRRSPSAAPGRRMTAATKIARPIATSPAPTPSAAG